MDGKMENTIVLEPGIEDRMVFHRRGVT